MKSNIVAVANEQVPIVTVCRMLGLELPDDVGEGRSRKVPCPFGAIYHSDGGVDPTMRIYPESNSAFCFSCSISYTPVALAAKGMGLNPHAAAARLLDVIGYRPMDLAGQWSDALAYAPVPDTAMMADALKTFCRRVCPAWSSAQFEPQVAAVLTRCLSLLDLVKTEQDVEPWLTRCKEAMQVVLASVASKEHAVLSGDTAHHQEGLC